MKKIKKNKSHSNFLKKWLIKINRKLGFELIDQNNLTFSTRENTEEQSVTEINKKIITLPLGEIEIKNKVKSLLIIFRSFTNENKLNHNPLLKQNFLIALYGNYERSFSDYL